MNWYFIHPALMRYLTDSEAWTQPEQAATHDLSSLIFRPVQANDVDLILEMHQRLSAETIYNRYLSPRLPTRQEIVRLCELGEANGRVLVAVAAGKRTAVVGLAYYIVSEAHVAETALLVEDRYQGQGLGKQLLHQLACLALVQGIYYFDALVLPSNKPMLHLLHHVGLVIQNRLDYGTREMRVQLTAVPPSAPFEAQKPQKAIALPAR